MKHTGLIPLLALTLGLLAAPLARSQQVVTLTGDPWPPYVLGNLGEEATEGLGVDIIRAVFARIEDVEVRFPLMPWKRALREVEQGTQDGIALLLKTPEREKYILFSKPVIASRSLVWHRADRFPHGLVWTGLSDLLDYRIGMIRGYSYGDAVDAARRSGTLKVSEVASVRQLFQMLARGRVDIAFANDAVGQAMARSFADQARIISAEGATNQDVYHIGFSRRSLVLGIVPEVDRAIHALQEEGTIQNVMDVYFARQ